MWSWPESRWLMVMCDLLDINSHKLLEIEHRKSAHFLYKLSPLYPDTLKVILGFIPNSADGPFKLDSQYYFAGTLHSKALRQSRQDKNVFPVVIEIKNMVMLLKLIFFLMITLF
jgi:hypothetical protein